MSCAITLGHSRVGGNPGGFGFGFGALTRSTDFTLALSVVSPKGDLLFFASPKKSKQKKGDPDTAVLRTALRCSGRGALRNSRARSMPAQTILAQKTPSSLRFSAPPKGPKVKSAITSHSHGIRCAQLDSRFRGNDNGVVSAFLGERTALMRWLCCWAPWEVPRSAGFRGAVREDCLSEASSAAPPKAEHRRAVRSTTVSGRLSFAYFSLAKQRKVSRPLGETTLEAKTLQAERVSATNGVLTT